MRRQHRRRRRGAALAWTGTSRQGCAIRLDKGIEQQRVTLAMLDAGVRMNALVGLSSTGDSLPGIRRILRLGRTT